MKQAIDDISPFIESLGLARKLWARQEDLNSEELFNVYILRCISSKKEIILFESPEPYDIYIFSSWLNQTNLEMKLWIGCLIDRAPVVGAHLVVQHPPEKGSATANSRGTQHPHLAVGR